MTDESSGHWRVQSSRNPRAVRVARANSGIDKAEGSFLVREGSGLTLAPLHSFGTERGTEDGWTGCDEPLMPDQVTTLSHKQRRFAAEYVVDFNATRAARVAGYSERSVRSIASSLLTNINIQREIAAVLDERLAAAGARLERVLFELAAIAFTDFGDVASWDQSGFRLVPSESLPPTIRAAISAVSVRRRTADLSGCREVINERVSIKLHDKVRALELLLRYLELAEQDAAGPPEGQATRQSDGNAAAAIEAGERAYMEYL